MTCTQFTHCIQAITILLFLYDTDNDTMEIRILLRNKAICIQYMYIRRRIMLRIGKDIRIRVGQQTVAPSLDTKDNLSHRSMRLNFQMCFGAILKVEYLILSKDTLDRTIGQ